MVAAWNMEVTTLNVETEINVKERVTTLDGFGAAEKKKKVFQRVVIIICLTGILKHIYITQHNLSLSNEIIK